jgi:hypothetical protein
MGKAGQGWARLGKLGKLGKAGQGWARLGKALKLALPADNRLTAITRDLTYDINNCNITNDLYITLQL